MNMFQMYMIPKEADDVRYKLSFMLYIRHEHKTANCELIKLNIVYLLVWPVRLRFLYIRIILWLANRQKLIGVNQFEDIWHDFISLFAPAISFNKVCTYKSICNIFTSQKLTIDHIHHICQRHNRQPKRNVYHLHASH